MFECLAIIPARGGSKRIKKKNIKDFCGKPILSYSLSSALISGCFNEVMVSTDDEEIAFLAKKLGANIPCLRSKENSDDFAGTADVLKEVLFNYQDNKIFFKYVCCIYPTAPFITEINLQKSFDILKQTKADSVISVVKFSYPIQRALKIDKDEHLKMIYPENKNVRSQDLEPTFHDAGQFYWLNVEKFLLTGEIFSENSVPFELPEITVQDIDTEEDWQLAELKYKILKGKMLI